MRKFLHLILLLCITVGGFAQTTVQGHPRPDLKEIRQTKSTKSSTSFTFEDIKYWVGEGSKKAALVIQWNDGKEPDAVVWGYKWDGEAYGVDMVAAIAKVDKRFYALFYGGTQYGTAIGGLGFDIDGEGTIGLALNGNTTYPKYPKDGIVNTSNYDFDNWTALDDNDHWQSGWTSKGYWSYYVKDDEAADFGYSGLGASSRELIDGSWDAWNFMPDFSMEPLSDNFKAIEPYVAPVMDLTKGIFFVNEDWFGWSNGSVNFMNENYKMFYRVYSELNNNEAFGATTQYGTIYGDKFYFVSKQAKDGGDTQRTPGGRLVVAEAATLKKIEGFDNIGGGDGRSFLGVTESVGYIGASNGIYRFDIDKMEVGEVVEGTGGGSAYSGQIGTMAFTGKYVFAVKQSKGVYVIDPETHTIIKTFEGSFNTLAQSKDGNVWLAQSNKLFKVNPYTLEHEEIDIPSGMSVGNSWGAWNAGSFCASIKQNVLYWSAGGGFTGGGSKITRYDIDKNEFNGAFFTLPDQDKTYKQMFYGAGLRVDPVTDNLVMTTTESGFSSHYQQNWIHIVDNQGNLVKTVKLDNYYWFPSVPVFPDNHAPVISNALFSEITTSSKTPVDISLGDKVTDEDNLSAAISKYVTISDDKVAEVSVANDHLIITPKASYGTANIKLKVNSNGKLAEKDIVLNIISKPEITKQPEPAEKFLNESVTLSVEAVGGLLTYQWYKDGVEINGATTNTYAIAKTAITDNGKYHCVVTNDEGSVKSTEVILTVLSDDVSLYGFTINGENWDIEDRYIMECGGSDNLVIKITTEANAKVFYNGSEVPNKEISVNIAKPSIKDVAFEVKSQDGTAAKPYTLTVEKYFGFNDLVITRWNNTLIVNNNSTTNGGYSFTAYKWYKNGSEIGNNQYYSAGSSKSDILDKDAEYYVQVTTSAGEVLRTCATRVTLKSMDAKVYPNPVKASELVYVEVDLDSELMDKAVIEIYTIMGMRVSSKKVEDRITPVSLPDSPGTYMLKVRSGDFLKDIKVIVK